MDQLSKKTLSEQIHDILRQEILTQVIPCGEKLTIRQLQARFGTSSTPVRDAMVRLAQEGLLDQVSNAGARVVRLTEQDVREIYEMCRVLDAAALGAALRHDGAAFLQALRQNVAQQALALERGDLDAFRLHSDAFHDLFYLHAGNRRLTEAAVHIRGQLSILTNRWQNLQRAETIILGEHRALVALLGEAEAQPGAAATDAAMQAADPGAEAKRTAFPEHVVARAHAMLAEHIGHGLAFVLAGLDEGV